MKKAYIFIVALLLTLCFSANFLQITVQAEEAQQGTGLVSLSVTSYFNETTETVVNINDQNYGSKVSFESSLTDDSDYAFAYWVVNGVVYEDLPVDYQFVLINDMDLIAVFHPITPTLKYAVLFMDTNGDKLDLQYIESGNAATAPSSGLPDKPGYNISSTPWSVATSTVTENTVSVLQYELDTSSTYTLSVTNGTVGGEASDSFVFNEIATVVADTPGGGSYFHHWRVEDRTVSYQSSYSFTMLENTTIEAVYGPAAPSDLPMVTLSDNLELRAGYNSYLGQFYLPTGYEMVEVGVISSEGTDFLDLDSISSTVYRNQVETYNGSTKEFVKTIEDTKAVTVRAYLVYSYLDTLYTIYDQPAYQVLNGDFETGDLSGWNSYRIWKDESGMDAFVDDRVIDGTYFGSNPYDRDGTYNLGVVGGSVTWDQSSERMGHLRSSDFTLGGTGMISFKLGGGKTTSMAYVSVRKTTDNTEVARFGNRHYNDTTVASTQYGSSISNAEAFMFQYYFDLSAVATIGESYYFVITEEAAYDWCILSADSFDTYFETAVTPSADQLATNIVPTILNTGTASNAIVNGYFDDGLNNWDNADSSWYLNSGQARSNEHGDSDLGVLRSSAFTVNGTGQYLRFDWAGGLKYDKQIFVSIKEVDTNIEVLRYVRRDNQSGKENENFDNHMLDLSGLDTSKQYYIEFCDNRTGSWGISYVDGIRLVDETEWNSVTSDDRAVSVTPLQLDFIYVKNY
jgi:hypothetical protein